MVRPMKALIEPGDAPVQQEQHQSAHENNQQFAVASATRRLESFLQQVGAFAVHHQIPEETQCQENPDIHPYIPQVPTPGQAEDQPGGDRCKDHRLKPVTSRYISSSSLEL